VGKDVMIVGTVRNQDFAAVNADDQAPNVD
jgi:hypothetical protein